MNRSIRTFYLGAVLCLIPFSACLCGPPPGEDAGPADAGEGEGEGECGFVGVECTADEDCCGTLACNASGVCGQPPACVEDDDIAGNASSPTSVDDVSPDDQLHACGDSIDNVDVFSFTATEGELIKLAVVTLGVTGGQVTGSDPDIDLWLFAGPPTGLQQDQNGGVLPAPQNLAIDASSTLNATEGLLFEVPPGATGTYYAVVTLYGGPEGDYNFLFERLEACEVDADCSAGYCRIDADLELQAVVQRCDTWDAPSCGDGDDEAGGDVHSDSNAVTLSGSAMGLICAPDIDVFTFEKGLRENAILNYTGSNTGTDSLVFTLIDGAGEISDVTVVNADTPEAQTIAGAGGRSGTWYVYVDRYGDPTGTDDASYTIDLDLRDSCRTDADCTGGDVCGGTMQAVGFVQMCSAPVADACNETDADNSASEATLLTSGSSVDATNCMGALDWYRVPLDGAINDVVVDLSWTGAADLDLYAVAADGTRLGAGWYGSASERWAGDSLPAGDVYFAVDVYSCGETFCDDAFEYSITATVTSGSPCVSDNGCVVGGTSAIQGAADPEVGLACLERPVGGGGDTDAGPVDAGYDAGQQTTDAGAVDGGADGGTVDAGPVDAGSGGIDAGSGGTDAGSGGATALVCVRPVEIALFDKATGDGCFDGADCAGAICLNSVCTVECAGGDDDATCSGLGSGAYCYDLQDPGLCLPECTDNGDCQAVFGNDTTLQCFEGECAIPN